MYNERKLTAGLQDFASIHLSVGAVTDYRTQHSNVILQIKDKSCPKPCVSGGRKLVKIGAEFSVEEHGLSRWILKSR
ncbi:MAG: hypothetical protein LBH60_08220 [Prevotellaceae bacterium]|jgi:hypothetical protein|nr:hypothetical protein [Prevotellaceae bacterium]